jgi:hypothetical protein
MLRAARDLFPECFDGNPVLAGAREMRLLLFAVCCVGFMLRSVVLGVGGSL